MFYKKVLEHVLADWSEVEADIILDGVMVFGERWQIFRVSLRHGCRAIPLAWSIVEGKGLVKVARLQGMLEKVQKILKKYVKQVTFFCRCRLPRLRLGPIMPKIGLELWDSRGLQHLHDLLRWKIRPTGQLGSRALQPLFPKYPAHSGGQDTNECVCNLDNRQTRPARNGCDHHK